MSKTTKSGTDWNQEDIDFLSQNIDNYTIKELAEKFGRTEVSIQNKISKLKLKRFNKKAWTEEEIKFLKENVDKIFPDELSKILNRTKSSISHKCQSLKIKMKIKGEWWTQKDIDYITQNYTAKTVYEMSKVISRNINSINQKLIYLKLDSPFKKVIKPWAQEEIDFVKANIDKYSFKDLGKILDRSPDAISNKFCGQRQGRIITYDYLSDFQKISPELAYVLGFISGDGWISRPDAKYYQVMVANKISDRIYLEPTFMKVTNWQVKHKVEKTNFRQDQIRFTISNKALINFLNEDLDLKNKNKYFSQKLIDFVPEQLHQYLLRGLFDADGGVYFGSERSFSFDIASNKDYDWTTLKNFINTKVDSNIIVVKYHIKHSNSDGSRIKANGFGAAKFLRYIYQNMSKDNIGFTRKFIRYVRFLENRAAQNRNTNRKTNNELLGV